MTDSGSLSLNEEKELTPPFRRKLLRGKSLKLRGGLLFFAEKTYNRRTKIKIDRFLEGRFRKRPPRGAIFTPELPREQGNGNSA